MKFKALIVMLALLPGIAVGEALGHSQWDPALGGYRYYSAPNAARDNALATQNMLQGFRMLQQQGQFNRQMELSERMHQQRMRELRAENERQNQLHNEVMRQIGILKEHRDAGRISQDEVDNLVRSIWNQSSEERAFRLRVFNSTVQ